MSNEFIPKQILYEQEMLDKLDEGSKAVHDVVGKTMGPSGNLVMYEEGEQNPYPTVTKDGVSVASMIAFKDQAKNMGSQFVIQAARKQVYETGDGTTLTSILTYKIFKEGRKLITGGFSPNDIIKGIRAGVENICTLLIKQSQTKVDIEALKKIARVSTSKDDDLSNKVAEAVYNTGKYGMVFQEKAQSDEHEVEYQDGYPLNIGIQYKEFANVEGKLLSLKKPWILVTDQTLVDFSKVLPIYRKIKEASKEDSNPSLIIIAPFIGGDMLQVMQRNIIDPDGKFHVVHIKPTRDMQPEKMKMVLEDLAAFTGALFLSNDCGYQIDQLDLEHLGTCDTISSFPDKTIVTGPDLGFEERIKQLNGILEMSNDEYTKQLISESLAKLTGGIAIIKVGGRNLTEQTEIAFRVDDAVKACKSAQEMGYLRGGGVAMLEVYRILENKADDIGYSLIKEILKYPTEIILKNAKKENWQSLINTLSTSSMNGYNIKEGTLENDMYDLNIIDPTKVIVYALKNAASAAISMLQTGAMIITEVNNE